MIGIFKNNLFFNSLLLLPYLILIRINTFINPKVYEAQESDSIISKAFFGVFESGFGQSIIALLLIYFHMLFINRFVIKHRLSISITLLPGLFYGFLCSVLPEYSMLSPNLIANTFILIALGQIYNLYKNQEAAAFLFNIGFFIACSSLFVPNYIVLILLGIIGIFVLRSMKLKGFMQMVSGVITVLFVFSGIMYLLEVAILPELAKLSLVPRLHLLNLRGEMLYKASIIFGLGVFTVLKYNQYTLKKSIQVQKKVDILYWFMIVQLIMVFFYIQMSAHLALLIFVPLSILLSISFLRIKSDLLQELIHLAGIVLLFLLNFGFL